MLNFDIMKKRAGGSTVAQGLPFQELNSDGTILTSDWGLLKCWSVVYPDASMSATRAEEASSAVALAFRRKADSQGEVKTAYWFCTHRVPLNLAVSPEQTGEVNMVGGDLEVERHRNMLFSDKNENLVNLNYCCCKVAVKVDDKGINLKSRRKAEEIFNEFESAIRTTGARLVPLRSGDETGKPIPPDENIMVFLKYCTNMEYRSWRCPKSMVNFSDFLSTLEMEKGKPMRMGDLYVQNMTMNDFPSATYPGILSALLTLPFQFRWSTRWIPFSNKESQVKAKNLRNAYRGAQKSLSALAYEETSGKESQNIDTQAVVDTQAMEEVMVRLAKDETLGEMTSVITVWDKEIDPLVKKVQKVHEMLTTWGFDAITETPYSNFQAWQSSLPGDSISGRRRPLVTAANISHIIPFTTMFHGIAGNAYINQLVGLNWHHIMGRLRTRELYYLNLNGGTTEDVGNTLIIGAVGSGKSVFLSLMGSQWARYPGSRVILFDKDQSFRNICERSGGAVYIPGAPDSPLSFMPLSRIKTNPGEALEWLQLAVESTGVECKPVTTGEMREVVEKWDDRPPTLQRFVDKLSGRYPNSMALPALRKILSREELARLFGGESDSFNSSCFGQKTMIEMNDLMSMGDMAIYPALAFIFSRIDELFNEVDENGIPLQNRHPTLLIMDEAWLFLKHPRFRAKIEEWLKTLRKKRVFIVMATQNIGDIDKPETFLTNIHTKIFLANPELKGEGAEDVKIKYKGFGVTDEELEEIGNATRKRHYYIKQTEGAALVDFCVDSYQLQRLAKDGR